MLGHGIVQAGAFISFRYVIPAQFQKPGVIDDPNKEIMVLHPNWNNQVHGIDLKRLTPAQVDVLKLIMDPATKEDQTKLAKYPLVKDILNRMDPPELIKNPIAFYSMMVKPFLNRADAYRRYHSNRMYSQKLLESSKVIGAVSNPAPLFKKI